MDERMSGTQISSESSRYVLGAGYNPAFTLAPQDTPIPLHLPDTISYLELGLAELPTWLEHAKTRKTKTQISLHLARTPITEDSETQDCFIDYIVNGLEKTGQNADQIISIGLHLTGPRDQGIGMLGFSSHYTTSVSAQKRAVRFIEQLSQRTRRPVWIENANFYSPDITSVIDSWRSVTSITQQTQAGLIVDLSHVLIDTRNNGVDPRVVIGAIPWGALCEIHLSGIIEAKDGSFHDGHSAPVHEQVWDLLETCLDSVIDPNKPCIITIEHTDPNWRHSPHAFHADFKRLQNLLTKTRTRQSKAEQSAAYARSYLKKLLNQWLPNVKPLCSTHQIDYGELVDAWIDQVTTQQKKRIVLTQAEIPEAEQARVELAARSFLDYAKQRLAQC